jgi:hypothetical protein
VTDRDPIAAALEDLRKKEARERERPMGASEHAHAKLEPLGFEVAWIRTVSVNKSRPEMLEALGFDESNTRPGITSLPDKNGEEAMVFLKAPASLVSSPKALAETFHAAGYRLADFDEVLAAMIQVPDVFKGINRVAAFGSTYDSHGTTYSVFIQKPDNPFGRLVNGFVHDWSLQNDGALTIPVVRLPSP